MKLIKKIIVIYLVLVGCASAEIVDEINNGEIANKSITDRTMNKSLNLHSIQKIFDTSKLTVNVRKEVYSEKRIYKIRLRESMITSLILPEKEKIAAYSLGDKTNFQFIPNKSDEYNLDNFTTISGTYPGADTNLTIIGESGRVYPYYIRIDSVDSTYDPDFIHRIVLTNNETKNESLLINKDQNINELDEKTKDYLRKLPDIEIGNLSFKYEALKGGNNDLSPIRIFDDGYFTYFQYSKADHIDKPRSLPVLYRVVDGFDTPVNTRIEKGMLVAETVSDKWTLRAGTAYLCIRKEK